jgi:hypothetical protein
MINLYCIRPKGFNIGNDVIYLGLNHFVRSSFKEAVNIISLPATAKYEANKKAGLSSQTIYEVNQFGHGLIIGGGNLYENGELEVNSTALKALEVPMMLFSLARGKIYNRNLELVDRTDVMTDDKIALINKAAAVSLARDKATFDYLKQLGCTPVLGGCPTLFINEIPQHLVPISEKAKTDTLISIRLQSLMSIPVDLQYKLQEDLTGIIALLKASGYTNVKFLCHDHRDIPFAASFKDMEYLYTEDAYTYLTFLRNTRLNITYRLHSFLPCMAFDVPAIKISYDQRALSMVETIGLKEWNIDMIKDNVLQEVKKRIGAMGDLSALKSKLRASLWKDLRQTLVHECDKFAQQVEKVKAQ